MCGEEKSVSKYSYEGYDSELCSSCKKLAKQGEKTLKAMGL